MALLHDMERALAEINRAKPTPHTVKLSVEQFRGLMRILHKYRDECGSLAKTAARLQRIEGAAREFFEAEDAYEKVGPQDPLDDWDTGDVEAQCEAAKVVADKKAALRKAVEEGR